MTKIKLILFVLYFLIIRPTSAQTPSIIWQKTYGGTKPDKAEEILQTRIGDIFIVGESTSTDIDLSENKGSFDAVVIKLNKTGTVLWRKSIGGSGDDFIHGAIELPDGSIICIGESFSNTTPFNNLGNSDIFACRISPNGELIWLKNYGGIGNDFGISVALHPDGNILIAGNSETTQASSHGQMDIILYKIDTSGNIIWTKNFGGSNDDFVKKIKKCSQGFIVIGDSMSNNQNIAGNRGGKDVCVLLLDWEGNIIWTKTFGGSNHDYSVDVIEDTDKNFVVAGETFSTDYDALENHRILETRDYFVIKISPQGAKIFTRCYGGEHNEYSKGIVQLYSGDYCILGESYSTSGQPTNNHGSADFWLIKTSQAQGDLIWERNYGGESHDEPCTLLLSFENTLLLGGNVSHPAGKGDVLSTYGGEDFWVAQLKLNDCERQLQIRDAIEYGNNLYQASESIQFRQKIEQSATKTIFQAGQNILLLPGFEIQSGNTFETRIQGCQ